MRFLLQLAARLRRDRKGATVVEYGLILALIFLAICGSISSLANGVINLWGNVSNEVGNHSPG